MDKFNYLAGIFVSQALKGFCWPCCKWEEAGLATGGHRAAQCGGASSALCDTISPSPTKVGRVCNADSYG